MSRYNKAPSNFVVPESISAGDKQWMDLQDILQCIKAWIASRDQPIMPA